MWRDEPAATLRQASLDGFFMGKGRFVNQKLGKNVTRKFGLLKSELAGRGKLKTPLRVNNQRVSTNQNSGKNTGA
jgi:hypothetical protein